MTAQCFGCKVDLSDRSHYVINHGKITDHDAHIYCLCHNCYTSRRIVVTVTVSKEEILVAKGYIKSV